MRLAITAVVALAALFASSDAISTAAATKTVHELDASSVARVTNGHDNEASTKRLLRETKTSDDLDLLNGPEERSSGAIPEVTPASVEKVISKNGIIGKGVDKLLDMKVSWDAYYSKMVDKLYNYLKSLKDKMGKNKTYLYIMEQLEGLKAKFSGIKINDKTIAERTVEAHARRAAKKEAAKAAELDKVSKDLDDVKAKADELEKKLAKEAKELEEAKAKAREEA